MKITITIDTENDAFQPEPVNEVNRILHDVQVDIRGGGLTPDTRWVLRDSNGNTVGEVTVTD